MLDEFNNSTPRVVPEVITYWQQQADFLEKELEYNGHSPNPHACLGRISLLLGELGRAQECFEAANTIEPEEPSHLYNLGYAYLYESHPKFLDAARDIFEYALKVLEENLPCCGEIATLHYAQIYRGLGECALRKGNLPEACLHLSNANKCKPEDRLIQARYKMCLSLLEQETPTLRIIPQKRLGIWLGENAYLDCPEVIEMDEKLNRLQIKLSCPLAKAESLSFSVSENCRAEFN